MSDRDTVVSRAVAEAARIIGGVWDAAKPGWISVKDRLPEAEVTVLAVKQLKDGRREICLARCIPEFTFYDYRTDREVTEPRWVCGGNNNILFWMPLPDMPKEG